MSDFTLSHAAAYVVLVIAGAFGFWRIDQQTQDIEARTTVQYTYDTCIAGNATRTAIIDIIVQASGSSANADLATYARARLPQRDCLPIFEGKQPVNKGE